MFLKLKKRKLVIVLVVFLIALALVSGCFIQYRYINHKYPEPIVVEYKKGETFHHWGVEMNFTEFEILELDQFAEKYNINIEETSLVFDNKPTPKIALTTLYLFNDGEEPAYLSLGELLLLETDGWASYMDLPNIFIPLNPGISTDIILNPGSEVTLYVGYSLYAMNFSESDYNNIENTKFKMVFQLYPTKKIIDLN